MAGMARKDWVGSCNNKGQPLADFSRAWCARCLNPDCTRSLHGKMQMDVRAATWEQRLFTEVPLLRPEDPRFGAVTRQSFAHIEVGRTPEIRTDWTDPHETPTVPERPPVMPADKEPAEESPTSPEATPAPRPEGFQTESPALSPPLYGANAPNQGGRMLQGRPATPVSDPWAGPVIPRPAGGLVVTPGAKVRLGGVPGGGRETKP
jgi:hypothetical protein